MSHFQTKMNNTSTLRSRLLRRSAWVVAAVALVLLLATAGGANYLLGYALDAQPRSRNLSQAWTEMDSLYPGLIHWRDSLRAAHNWTGLRTAGTDGTPLHAVLIRAPRATRRTAVLVHGYTDCHVRMMQLARMYADSLSANVLVPDLHSAGLSGGDDVRMGWKDRLDVEKWLGQLPRLVGDSVEAVVHGVSMGAATTLMVSGDRNVPDFVKAYVDDCGYTSVDAQFTKELKERFGLPRWPLIPAASALCEARYGWNFREASALEQVKKATRPVLFIHGDADLFVPTAMGRELAAACPTRFDLWIVPGAPHARSYKLFPYVYRQHVERLLRHVGM